jgi:hypothetical protein
MAIFIRTPVSVSSFDPASARRGLLWMRSSDPTPISILRHVLCAALAIEPQPPYTKLCREPLAQANHVDLKNLTDGLERKRTSARRFNPPNCFRVELAHPCGVSTRRSTRPLDNVDRVDQNREHQPLWARHLIGLIRGKELRRHDVAGAILKILRVHASPLVLKSPAAQRAVIDPALAAVEKLFLGKLADPARRYHRVILADTAHAAAAAGDHQNRQEQSLPHLILQPDESIARAPFLSSQPPR